MSAIKAIILDFDGVVVESNEEKGHAFGELFALYPAYRQAMMDYHLANYSSPRMMKFEHYVYKLMGRPGDVELVETMAQQFSHFVMRRVIACPEVPGAQAFLEEFSEQVPFYISSNTPHEELLQIIQARGIDSFFVDVFGNPPYRKAEAIGMVLAREQVLPHDVLFVGDSPSDYRVAVEAELEFVGRKSNLPFEGIDITLHNDLYEIARIVRSRLKGKQR